MTHDVDETFAIVDYAYVIGNGRVVAGGTPDELRRSTDPQVRQFLEGERDDPVPFHYPAPPIEKRSRHDGASHRAGRDAGSAHPRMAVGHRSCDPLLAATFWLALLSLRRPRLIVDQIHFIGNYSLSIVAVLLDYAHRRRSR